MSNPKLTNAAPALGWDIAMTRMTNVITGQVRTCALGLQDLLRDTGLKCTLVPEITLSGKHLRLAIKGGTGLGLPQRRTLCTFEFHVVDGMKDCNYPGLALDVNFCSPEGEILVFVTPTRPQGSSGYYSTAELALQSAKIALTPSVLYALIVQRFDLITETPRPVL